jgi:surfactin synthase thioesterase subunit
MTEAHVDADLWVRKLCPADAGVRLACFPHAGGAASFYFPLAQRLAPSVEVLGVQYPGRQDRYGEPCIEEIPALVDGAFRALEPWLDKPLALFGHSMGATVAFEVARRMEAEHRVPPAALFLSGRSEPTGRRPRLMSLGDDEELVAEIRRLRGTDPRVLADEDMLRLILPAFRGDYTAVERYRYLDGPRLTCPVTVLTGDSDPMVSPDDARGWREYTDGAFAQHVFPGDHFFLVDHHAAIVEIIRRQVR